MAIEPKFSQPTQTTISRVPVILLGILLGADLLTLGFLAIGSYDPLVIEIYYSKGFYPLFASLYAPLADWFPFSISEIAIVLVAPFLLIGIGYILLVAFSLLLWVVRSYILYRPGILDKKASDSRWVKPLWGWTRIKRWSIRILWGLSMVFLLFEWFWGMNYLRVPLEEKMVWGTHFGKEQAHNPEQFKQVLFLLINRTNQNFPGFMNVEESPPIPFETIVHQSQISLKTAFISVENQWIESAQRMKFSQLQLLETFFVHGVVSPWFHESHYARDLFFYEMPFLIAHEKSHLQGYARESDCNFMAFLACVESEEPYIRFSGYFSTLRYFLREISDRPDLLQQAFHRIRPEILLLFQKSRERHQRKQPAFQAIATQVYSVYLQANRIEEGIENYNRMVELILGFYQPAWFDKEG